VELKPFQDFERWGILLASQVYKGIRTQE